MGHVTLTLFAVVLFLTSPDLRVAAEEGRYPQDALECYASSALQSQKEGRIICPPGKSHLSPKSVPRRPPASSSSGRSSERPHAQARPCA